eukprot:scaffold12224_cov40-Cyclotella_meneghiniana.AAC.7
MKFSTLCLHAIRLGGAVTTASVLRDLQAPQLDASFDSQFGAPRCSGAATSCDSGSSLLVGRSNTAISEQNHPNTITACADGNGGSTSSHINRIIVRAGNVFQADPSNILVPGRTATIIATVNSPNFSADMVDFYFASDATNPQWQRIGSLRPSRNGVGNVMISYTLPVGIKDTQAVRVQFRYMAWGTAPTSTCQGGLYNDRDDLVFDVILPSNSPSISPSLSSPQPSSQHSSQPSSQPSFQPSSQPSSQPSESTQPSSTPSSQPSSKPSELPSFQPSESPSDQPSSQPSESPSSQPSSMPSHQPSSQPSSQPSMVPSEMPSTKPSDKPSSQPSLQPSISSQPSITMQPSIVIETVTISGGLSINQDICSFSAAQLEAFVEATTKTIHSFACSNTADDNCSTEVTSACGSGRELRQLQASPWLLEYQVVKNFKCEVAACTSTADIAAVASIGNAVSSSIRDAMDTGAFLTVL